MPTDDDFLAAVIADPDSDVPRLIYADWLEENGDDARAEFIRIQCALDSVPEDERNWHPLAERNAVLLGQNYDEWVRPLDGVLFPGGESEWWQPIRSALVSAAGFLRFGGSWQIRDTIERILEQRWRFRRGFAEKLHIKTSILIPVAAELVRVTPLRSLVAQLDELIGLAELANVEPLCVFRSLAVFGNGEEPSNLDSLLVSPNLNSIRRLGFQNFAFDQGDFERLAQSTMFSRLERLTLVGSSAGNGDRLSGLLQALPSAKLDRLALGAMWTDLDARHIIGRIPSLPHLTQLDLPNNPLGDISLEALLERLPKLTHLNLGGTGLSDVVLRSIMNSPRLRQLHWLDLSGATISDQCAIDLLDSASFGGLTRLNLRGTALSEPVQRALRVRLEDRVLL